MLTSITSDAASSTGNQVSSVESAATPPVATPSAIPLSLKTQEANVLDQADMYSLENSLDNNHLLQVSLPPHVSALTAREH